MQSLGGEDVRLDEPIERHQRKGGGPDLVGKRLRARRWFLRPVQVWFEGNFAEQGRQRRVREAAC